MWIGTEGGPWHEDGFPVQGIRDPETGRWTEPESFLIENYFFRPFVYVMWCCQLEYNDERHIYSDDHSGFITYRYDPDAQPEDAVSRFAMDMINPAQLPKFWSAGQYRQFWDSDPTRYQVERLRAELNVEDGTLTALAKAGDWRSVLSTAEFEMIHKGQPEEQPLPSWIQGFEKWIGRLRNDDPKE